MNRYAHAYAQYPLYPHPANPKLAELIAITAHIQKAKSGDPTIKHKVDVFNALPNPAIIAPNIPNHWNIHVGLPEGPLPPSRVMVILWHGTPLSDESSTDIHYEIIDIEEDADRREYTWENAIFNVAVEVIAMFLKDDLQIAPKSWSASDGILARQVGIAMKALGVKSDLQSVMVCGADALAYLDDLFRFLTEMKRRGKQSNNSVGSDEDKCTKETLDYLTGTMNEKDNEYLQVITADNLQHGDIDHVITPSSMLKKKNRKRKNRKKKKKKICAHNNAAATPDAELVDPETRVEDFEIEEGEHDPPVEEVDNHHEPPTDRSLRMLQTPNKASIMDGEKGRMGFDGKTIAVSGSPKDSMLSNEKVECDNVEKVLTCHCTEGESKKHSTQSGFNGVPIKFSTDSKDATPDAKSSNLPKTNDKCKPRDWRDFLVTAEFVMNKWRNEHGIAPYMWFGHEFISEVAFEAHARGEECTDLEVYKRAEERFVEQMERRCSMA